MPKATELNPMAAGMGRSLEKEVSKNPLNTNSSKIGAKIAVIANNPPKVIGSGDIIFTTSSTVLAPLSCRFGKLLSLFST